MQVRANDLRPGDEIFVSAAGNDAGTVREAAPVGDGAGVQVTLENGDRFARRAETLVEVDRQPAVGDVVCCEGTSAIVGDVVGIDVDGDDGVQVAWRAAATTEDPDDLVLVRARPASILDVPAEERRAELLSVCAAAIVPEAGWGDRDSYGAQFQVGQCWALLSAGCDFRVHGAGDDPASDAETTWLTTFGEGFQRFEHGDDVDKEEELHYLPTWARLERAAGKDWY